MIRLAPALNLDAATALAAELRGAEAPGPIDASAVTQLGQAALQLLIAARAAGFSLDKPSPSLCRAAAEAGASAILQLPEPAE